MTLAPFRRIFRISTAILAVLSVCAAVMWGVDFALGVLLSGILMMVSLGAGWWLTQPDASGRIAPRIPLLLSFKFPLVMSGAFGLLALFPAPAVALGGVVLVAAITLDALLHLPTQTTGEV